MKDNTIEFADEKKSIIVVVVLVVIVSIGILITWKCTEKSDLVNDNKSSSEKVSSNDIISSSSSKNKNK